MNQHKPNGVDIAIPERAVPASQATMVEQARAVAEVQAAVVVAQQCPRDIGRAEAEMRDVCGRLSLAQAAFYSVPNRGNGPSIHLARELARIWGNIDYGVRELRRDDEAGVSEVLAYATDLQTNAKNSRTFIKPHSRMKGGKVEKVVDLDDIYRSNQNTGSRAARECIFAVLPRWFTDAAKDTCRRTLENGEGVPLKDRITTMVAKFSQLGVRQADLEHRTGKKRSQWEPGDLSDLSIVYRSIQDGETTAADEFPRRAVTADDLPAPAVAQPVREEPPVEDPPMNFDDEEPRR